MIDTENLTKRVGSLTAVENLILHGKGSEVFGFLGPNGAGKIATVRMLSCLMSKTSGEARIGDFEIGKSEDSQKIRRITRLLLRTSVSMIT